MVIDKELDAIFSSSEPVSDNDEFKYPTVECAGCECELELTAIGATWMPVCCDVCRNVYCPRCADVRYDDYTGKMTCIRCSDDSL